MCTRRERNSEVRNEGKGPDGVFQNNVEHTAETRTTHGSLTKYGATNELHVTPKEVQIRRSNGCPLRLDAASQSRHETYCPSDHRRLEKRLLVSLDGTVARLLLSKPRRHQTSARTKAYATRYYSHFPSQVKCRGHCLFHISGHKKIVPAWGLLHTPSVGSAGADELPSPDIADSVQALVLLLYSPPDRANGLVGVGCCAAFFEDVSLPRDAFATVPAPPAGTFSIPPIPLS